MTILHTKGYQDVLEAVKERAERKAVAMARLPVPVHESIVLLALATLSHQGFFCAPTLTSDEVTDLHLLFAEDFLHHYRYELEQVRSEKASTEDVTL